jgi:acylphosphatase
VRTRFGGTAAVALLLFAASAVAARGGERVTLEPEVWNYGLRAQRVLIDRTVLVRPPAGARVGIELVQIACACLEAKMIRGEGTADSPAELRVTMDTSGLIGRTRHGIFVQLCEPTKETLRLAVTGWVRKHDGPGTVEVFYAATEPAGERFLEWWRGAAAGAETPGVSLKPLEDVANYRRLRELERKAELKGPAYEVIAFVDSKLPLKGEAEVRAGLIGHLDIERDGRPAPPKRKAAPVKGKEGTPAASPVPPAASPAPPSGTGPARLGVELYYFSNCRLCRDVLAMLRRAGEEYGEGRAEFRAKALDLDLDAIPELYAQLRLYPDIPRVVPSMILFVGDRVILGEEAILKDTRGVVREQLARGGAHLAVRRPAGGADIRAGERGLGLAAVVAAALADGVNPCAFAAMVLLVSVLSARGLAGPGQQSETGGSRRKVLLVGGISFVGAVFLTYFLTGLGLFAGVRALTGFPIAETLVFWAVWALAVAGGALSGADAVSYFRTRDPAKLRLKVPDSIRRRFAPILRWRFSRFGLAAGGVLAGIVIAVLEGVCTGQMYLPTIQLMARMAIRDGGPWARWVLYLALYNSLFVLPLVAILAAAVAGVQFQKLNAFLRRHLGWTKVLLALVFFGLAAVMLIGRWTPLST